MRYCNSMCEKYGIVIQSMRNRGMQVTNWLHTKLQIWRFKNTSRAVPNSSNTTRCSQWSRRCCCSHSCSSPWCCCCCRHTTPPGHPGQLIYTSCTTNQLIGSHSDQTGTVRIFIIIQSSCPQQMIPPWKYFPMLSSSTWRLQWSDLKRKQAFLTNIDNSGMG